MFIAWSHFHTQPWTEFTWSSPFPVQCTCQPFQRRQNNYPKIWSNIALINTQLPTIQFLECSTSFWIWITYQVAGSFLFSFLLLLFIHNKCCSGCCHGNEVRIWSEASKGVRDRASSFRKACSLTLWPQSGVMSLGGRGSSPLYFQGGLTGSLSKHRRLNQTWKGVLPQTKDSGVSADETGKRLAFHSACVSSGGQTTSW